MAKKTKISRKPKPSRKADFDDEKAVLREFCEAENCEPSHCSIEEDRRLRGFGVGTYYQIAKDHDSMRDLAI